MISATAIFVAGVVAAAVGQVLMKQGALLGRHRSVLASVLHPYVIAGYGLMLASTVMSLIALKVLPLHLTVALQPLAYVIVVPLSVAVLGERIRRRQVWGMVIILAGIVIFNLGTL